MQSLSRFLLEALNKEAWAALPGGGGQTYVEAIFAIQQRQRMQCLSRQGRPEQVKEGRYFQVDLQVRWKARGGGPSGCELRCKSCAAAQMCLPAVRAADWPPGTAC